MSRIYEGYPGGQVIYYHESNALYEAYSGGGSPVATISGNHVYFGRGATMGEVPAGSIESVSHGFEVYAGYGTNIRVMGFIHGDNLMDRAGGQVIMSSEGDDVEGLAMACVLRFGDSSLRTNVDVRDHRAREGVVTGKFLNYAGNVAHGMSPDEYMDWSRRNAGFGDDSRHESENNEEPSPNFNDTDSKHYYYADIDKPDSCRYDDTFERVQRIKQRKNYSLAARYFSYVRAVAKSILATAGLILGLCLIHSFVGDIAGTIVFGAAFAIPYTGGIGISCLFSIWKAREDILTYEEDMAIYDYWKEHYPRYIENEFYCG